MNQNTFKKIVNWFGILIAIHLIAWIIFAFFVSREMLLAYVDEEFGIARRIVFLFGITAMSISSIFYAYALTSAVNYKNDLKKAMKDNRFSVITYFKSSLLKDHLIRILIYALFQLPYTLLFAIRGLVLQNRTPFDGFYSMDICAYAITDSPILGLILNTLIFGIIFISSNFIALYLTKRNLKII